MKYNFSRHSNVGLCRVRCIDFPLVLLSYPRVVGFSPNAALHSSRIGLESTLARG